MTVRPAAGCRLIVKKFALLMLFSCVALSAQIRIVPREQFSAFNDPELCVDSAALAFAFTELDAPSMKEDSRPVELVFPVRNVSSGPVYFTRAVSSCSCVSVQNYAGKLEPGQSREIRVVYNPEGHPGKFRRQVFLYTAASEDQPVAVLAINAEIAPSGNPEREYPVSCGSLRLSRGAVELSGGVETVVIRCYNAGKMILRPSAQKAFVPFPVSFRCEPTQLKPGESGRIVLDIELSGASSALKAGEYPVIMEGCGGRPSESKILLIIF